MTFSRRLVEELDFLDAVGMETAELTPASTHIIDALEAYHNSDDQHKTAYSLQNATPLPISWFLAQHLKRGRRFDAGMRNLRRGGM